MSIKTILAETEEEFDERFDSSWFKGFGWSEDIDRRGTDGGMEGSIGLK